jgi:hypothetical protein
MLGKLTEQVLKKYLEKQWINFAKSIGAGAGDIIDAGDSKIIKWFFAKTIDRRAVELGFKTIEKEDYRGLVVPKDATPLPSEVHFLHPWMIQKIVVVLVSLSGGEDEDTIIVFDEFKKWMNFHEQKRFELFGR